LGFQNDQIKEIFTVHSSSALKYVCVKLSK